MDVVPLTSTRLVTLDDAACLEKLAGAQIGRVIMSIDALPAAHPVTYTLIGEDIVFRTRAGAKLDAALDHTVVGFEVDELDLESHSGWSVLAVGMADVVTDPDEIAELEQHDIRSWVGVDLPHYVRIRIAQLTGRLIPAPE